MENEENTGLINKKVYEDHFTTFLSIQFWSSLSHTLRHILFLENSSIREKKAKEGQERKGK